MNHIKIENVKTIYGYEENYWMIDEKTLPEYLESWAEVSDDERFRAMAPFGRLCPAWNKNIEWQGDVRFVWKVIEMENAVLPLLLCEDDADFSCIVIVVEVEKTEEFVYWNRIGYVLHENEDFEEEKKCGILHTDSYTEEDWEKYGDNIALESMNSSEWLSWIGENWEEELYRRRMNYTLPYYQTEGNVCWIKNVNWKFDRTEYEEMVNSFRKVEDIKF